MFTLSVLKNQEHSNGHSKKQQILNLEDFKEASRRGLLATIKDMEDSLPNLSNQSDNTTHLSNLSNTHAEPILGGTATSAETELKRLEMLNELEGLETEILHMTMFADDINDGEQEVGVTEEVGMTHQSCNAAPTGRSHDHEVEVSSDRLRGPASALCIHKRTMNPRVQQSGIIPCLDPNNSYQSPLIQNPNTLLSASPQSLQLPLAPSPRPPSPRPPPLRPQSPVSPSTLYPGQQSPHDKYSPFDATCGDTGFVRRRRKNKL